MDYTKMNKVALKEMNNLNFIVPSYQRGYRWNTIHVEQFIDDIYEDSNTDSNDYFIQPIMVKKKNDNFHVIDGQQRITTLLIMIGALKYLNGGEFKDNLFISLKYETRNQSGDFLDFLVVNNQQIIESVDNNLDDETALLQIWGLYSNQQSNLDFDYMLNTFLVAKKKYKNIFKNSGRGYELLYERLINKCKFMWYPIENSQGAGNHICQKQHEVNQDIEHFSKINMGKIPLTNAELIKAEFMNPEYYKGEYESHIKLIAEQWYVMEMQLRNPDFWAFIPHENQYEDNNIYRARLDEVFYFILIKNHQKKLSGKSFAEEYREGILQEFFLYNEISKWIKLDSMKGNKQESIFEKWAEVKETFDIIKELYEHDGRTQNYEPKSSNHINGSVGLYNFVGYFVYISQYILEESKYDAMEEMCMIIFVNREKRYTKIKDSIQKKLRKMLQIKKDEYRIAKYIGDLKYEEKNEVNNNKIRAILLLYNILLMSKNNGVGNRYDFLRYNKWSLEHIYSQNEEKIVYEEERFKEIIGNESKINKDAEEKIQYTKQKRDEKISNINKIKDLKEREDREATVEQNYKNEKNKIEKDKEEKIKKCTKEKEKLRSQEEVWLIRKEIINDLNKYYDKNNNIKDDSNHMINRISILFEQLDMLKSKSLDYYLNQQEDIQSVLIYNNNQNHILREIVEDNEDGILKFIMYNSTCIDDIYNKINEILKYEISVVREDSELEDSYNIYQLNKSKYGSEVEMYYDSVQTVLSCIKSQIIKGFFLALREQKQTIETEDNFKSLLNNIYCVEIEEYFNSEHNTLMSDNSINNLALLRSVENRKIANNFIHKKQTIYDFLQEGTVIPYSTLLVFFGAYSNINSITSGDKWQWLPESREKYGQELMKSIDVFFTDEKEFIESESKEIKNNGSH